MKIRSELILDKAVARPAAYLLNFLVRLAGKIFRINHSLDRRFNCIVVCKFKGLGSIIQSTPMLQALKESHPESRIVYVTTCGNLPFVEKIPVVDEVILLDDRSIFRLIGTLFKAIFRFWKLRPDVYIDLEIYSNFSTLVALFSLAKNRIGYYLRASSFRTGIYTHMMFFNTTVPISEVYLQIARLLGKVERSPGLFPLVSTVKKTAQIYRHPYMVINPNASDLRVERRWPADYFVQLIGQLLTEYPEFTFYLIGSKSEAAYVDTIQSKLTSERVIDLSGKTNADELIQLIAGADRMITNDTGPMHLAFSSQTPVVCLFGPCSPEQYGWNENVRILYKNVYCSPCVHEFATPPCMGNNICMKLITVAEVAEAVRSLSVGRVFSERTEQVVYSEGNDVLGRVNNRKVL